MCIRDRYEAGIKYEPPGQKALITLSVFQLTQKSVCLLYTSPPCEGRPEILAALRPRMRPAAIPAGYACHPVHKTSPSAVHHSFHAESRQAIRNHENSCGSEMCIRDRVQTADQLAQALDEAIAAVKAGKVAVIDARVAREYAKTMAKALGRGH